MLLQPALFPTNEFQSLTGGLQVFSATGRDIKGASRRIAPLVNYSIHEVKSKLSHMLRGATLPHMGELCSIRCVFCLAGRKALPHNVSLWSDFIS